MTKKAPIHHRTSSIDQAKNLSSQGKDPQALATIEKHLQRFPRDLEALDLAGTLAARLANWPVAEKYFTEALSIDQANAYALYSLSKVFEQANRPGDAIDALTRLLKIDTRNVKALNQMGILLVNLGHLDPGLKALETAIEIDPSFEMAYRNLYATLFYGGRYEEAVFVAKQAIENIASDYRLKYRSDLVYCLCQTREFGEARSTAEQLIGELEHSDDPAHREIYLNTLNNLGLVLTELDEPEAAEALYLKIISLSPEQIDPYINLAKLSAFRENLREAIDWFDKALAIDPENARLHNHLAIFLRDANRPDLALPHHLSALARNPGDVEQRYYLGLSQLALGNLEEGFANHEFRWARREGGAKSDLPIPEWTGTPATGRSLLIYREQGIGDEISFASCLPDLLNRFERILCVCHSKLNTLFSRSFPQIEFRSGGEALTQADVDALDWQIAIGSLPRILRPDIASFPRTPQFLMPDPEKVAGFRQRLSPIRKKLCIGIGWRSGLMGVSRKQRYPYLEFWQALFDIADITWVNLQYGDSTEELRQTESTLGVSIVNFEDVDHLNDLDTSAALMKACDLMIGPGTSTTMLSAAVGVPSIQIYSGCEYFQLGTDHYPWLPSLTLIHRNFGDPWTVPIGQAATIVRSLVEEHSVFS